MSLLLVQLSPDDVVYRALGTPVLQAVLAVAVSLYKLRKACFLVQVPQRELARKIGCSTWSAPIQTGLIGSSDTPTARRL